MLNDEDKPHLPVELVLRIACESLHYSPPSHAASLALVCRSFLPLARSALYSHLQMPRMEDGYRDEHYRTGEEDEQRSKQIKAVLRSGLRLGECVRRIAWLEPVEGPYSVWYRVRLFRQLLVVAPSLTMVHFRMLPPSAVSLVFSSLATSPCVDTLKRLTVEVYTSTSWDAPALPLLDLPSFLLHLSALTSLTFLDLDLAPLLPKDLPSFHEASLALAPLPPSLSSTDLSRPRSSPSLPFFSSSWDYHPGPFWLLSLLSPFSTPLRRVDFDFHSVSDPAAWTDAGWAVYPFSSLVHVEVRSWSNGFDRIGYDPQEAQRKEAFFTFLDSLPANVEELLIPYAAHDLSRKDRDVRRWVEGSGRGGKEKKLREVSVNNSGEWWALRKQEDGGWDMENGSDPYEVHHWAEEGMM
ncbi:hypothetical protein JCM8547_000090 [Rhodosporidiobolus lusitaniae]